MQFASNFPLCGAWMKSRREGLSSFLASYLVDHSRQPWRSSLSFNYMSDCHTPLCLSYAFIYLFLWTRMGSPSSVMPTSQFFRFITGTVVDLIFFIHFTRALHFPGLTLYEAKNHTVYFNFIDVDYNIIIIFLSHTISKVLY